MNKNLSSLVFIIAIIIFSWIENIISKRTNDCVDILL
jgi:hypothetical protein